jgi:hypothetical protein
MVFASLEAQIIVKTTVFYLRCVPAPRRGHFSYEVATLAHEVVNHTMDFTALEMKRLAGLACTLLPCAQGPEVLSGLWHHICPEVHLNAAT